MSKSDYESREVKLSRLELNYLSTKRLGRLATVNRHGRPHVVPVIFSIGARDRIVISGAGFEKSYKFKNIKENPRVAFVADSVKLSPWTPMGIELRGIATETTLGNGQKGIEIIALKKVSWGLTDEEPPWELSGDQAPIGPERMTTGDQPNHPTC